MTTAFLSLQHVDFAYPGARAVVDDVSLDVGAGAFVCLLGRSGCGKSTLLRLAAGLLTPDAGQVRIDGAAVDGPQAGTSLVFQSPNLLDWLTVLDNVLLPLRLHQRVSSRERTRASALLASLGLDGLAQRRPHQLSGGQQSRVAIARALFTRPRLILMDEPFAALDAITREELQVLLLRVCREQQASVLFVTHDIAEAVYLGNRVAIMHAGRIVHEQSITLPAPRDPALRYGAAFNRLCARLRAIMAPGGASSARPRAHRP